MTAVRRLITIFVLSLAATALLAQETPAASRPRDDRAGYRRDGPATSMIRARCGSRSSEAHQHCDGAEPRRAAAGVRVPGIRPEPARLVRHLRLSRPRPCSRSSSQERAVSSTIESERRPLGTRSNVSVEQNLPTGGAVLVRRRQQRARTEAGGVTHRQPAVLAEHQLRVQPAAAARLRHRHQPPRHHHRPQQPRHQPRGLPHALMDTASDVEQAYLDLDLRAPRRRRGQGVALPRARPGPHHPDPHRRRRVRAAGHPPAARAPSPRPRSSSSSPSPTSAPPKTGCAQLLNLDPRRVGPPDHPDRPVEYTPVTIDVDDGRAAGACELVPSCARTRSPPTRAACSTLYSRNQILPHGRLRPRTTAWPAWPATPPSSIR